MSLGPGELAAAKSALTIAGNLGRKASAAMAAHGTATFAQLLNAGSELAEAATSSASSVGQTAAAVGAAVTPAGRWMQTLHQLIQQTLDRAGVAGSGPATLEFWPDGTILVDAADRSAVAAEALRAALAADPELQQHLARRPDDVAGDAVRIDWTN